MADVALPGGYIKDGEAFYVAFSQTTASGAVIKYGMAGVVQGPVDDKSIIVKFGEINLKCALEKIALTQPSLEFAGGYKLDDAVFFTGTTQAIGGVTLEAGTQGTVVGPGTSDKVAVKFLNFKAVIKIDLTSLSKSVPDMTPPDGVPLGTYIGHGSVNGCDAHYTLKLNEKKLFWLDYKSQPPAPTAPAEQWHADGRFDVAGDKVKATFGGLPGQGRQGQVWEFDVVVRGCEKLLMHEGVTLGPQPDTKPAPFEKPKEKVNKMKLGPYISPDFERTPDGKRITDTCRYTITLLEDNQLWLDFESRSKIDSSKWHCEGPYEETSDTTIQYKVEARPYGGGPAQNSVLSLDMDLKAGTITFDGQKCAFQGGITSVEMENVSQAKPDPKPAPKAEDKAAPTPSAATPAAAGETLTLEQLKDEKTWKAKGLDPANKETYLSDAEFQSLFGMGKAEFATQPKWKKETAKKKHGLY